ncbi:hypothetical protein KC316_g21811 [Hortaea werneckii]|nr:hypothetical protein KC324_g21882 [Hortaea werneckii]KAI7511591.1 hypothetical protein KC316_g21811 [Hortaea werneckii]
MHLENQAYEGWKAWAEKEVAAMKQMAGAAYTGTENEEATISSPEVPEQEDLQEVSDSVPASRRGQEAQGGAAVHP